VKLRTFITEDNSRDDLVEHVYDITYGVVNSDDTLVIIDDSIVRGTTLKKSILKMLDRLNPKKIVIVSSAPQIRYPDCYGIDMANLESLVAFNAALSLLKDSGMESLIKETYDKCKKELELDVKEMKNHVKEIYNAFTPEEISDRITQLLSSHLENRDVKIIFQSIENLHQACPDSSGDWYFTGNYPTPGGNRVVNTAFINFFEGNKKRAY
jgi:amidophosphoribosyltransferase